jgi:hypothetical protein
MIKEEIEQNNLKLVFKAKINDMILAQDLKIHLKFNFIV